MVWPKNCEQCGKVYDNNSLYSRHVRGTHQKSTKVRCLKGGSVTFHRCFTTGLFKCTCGYENNMPDLMRRHMADRDLNHIGRFPDGAHVTPQGVMVAHWEFPEGADTRNKRKGGVVQEKESEEARRARPRIENSGTSADDVEMTYADFIDPSLRDLGTTSNEMGSVALSKAPGAAGPSGSTRLAPVVPYTQNNDTRSTTPIEQEDSNPYEFLFSSERQMRNVRRALPTPNPPVDVGPSPVQHAETRDELPARYETEDFQISEQAQLGTIQGYGFEDAGEGVEVMDDLVMDADRTNNTLAEEGFRDITGDVMHSPSGQNSAVFSREELRECLDDLGIRFLEKYKVIICLDCESGIDPTCVYVHLKTHHSLSRSKEAMVQRLISFLKPLPVLEVQVPPTNQHPIDNLSISDGFVCMRCCYAAKNSGNVMQHISTGSCFSQTERANKGLKKYKPCKTQAFFPSLGRKVFAVRPEPDDRVSVNFKGLTKEMIEDEHVAFERFMDIVERSRPVGKVPMEEISPWLKKTRFVELFADVQLDEIASLMDHQRGTLAGYLKLVGKSIDRVFQDSIELWKTKSSAHSLRWMNSTRSLEYDKDPWDRVLIKTEYRYFSLMRKLVVYLFHMFAGRHFNRLPYSGLIVLNQEQTSCLAAVQRTVMPQGTKVDEVELDKQVSNLCTALIKQQFAEGDTKRTALLHAVAVSCIGSDGAFRPASLVGPDLAGIIYTCKVLFFRHACVLAQLHPEGTIAATVCEQYRLLHCAYIAPANLTPVAEIINLLGWAKSLGVGESSTPDLGWSQLSGRELITYKDIQIDVDKFKSMIHAEIIKAKRLLIDVFNIDSNKWSLAEILKISDNMSKRQRGYSFLTDPRNMELFPPKGKLDIVFQHKDLYNRLVRIVDKKILYMNSGKCYVMAKAQEILQAILALFHLMGGQPARATELIKITWKNSALRHRNIFIWDGGVLWITDYFKGRNAMGWSKFIPRFLSSEVAAIYICYIDKVLPLYEFFAGPDALGLEEERMHYLFSKDGRSPWPGTYLATKLQELSTAAFGEANSFTTASYRHVAISISRRYLEEGFDEEVGDEDEDPMDLQAAHSTHTADRVYAVRRDILNGISERSIKVFQALSISWHGFVYSPLTSPEWMKRKQKRKEAARRLAYGVGELMTTVEEKPLPAPAGYYSNGFPVVIRLPGSPDISRRCSSILTRIYGEDATFRSRQQFDGLKKVLEGVTPLLVILPTGGGKSLLFEGPASEKKAGVTVVIVPLVALRADLHKRAEGHGVSSQEWCGKTMNDTSLVFVSTEASVMAPFRRYVRYMITHGILDRIFIDESHMLLYGVDYRESYRDLFWFSGLGVQVILLTATLPPHMVRELNAAMMIDNTVVVRASANRTNIKYECIKSTTSYIQSQVLDIVQKVPKNPLNKVLVYTRSVGSCIELGVKLGCGIYHSESLGKDACLKDWLNGEKQALVATTALGAGIDVENIRLVIFMGLPHTFIDFAQGSGRGGRNGKPARAVVLYTMEEANTSLKDAVYLNDAQNMFIFANTDDCRRLVLSEYLDGSRKRCNSEQDILCDNCIKKGIGKGTDPSEFEEPLCGSVQEIEIGRAESVDSLSDFSPSTHQELLKMMECESGGSETGVANEPAAPVRRNLFSELLGTSVEGSGTGQVESSRFQAPLTMNRLQSPRNIRNRFQNPSPRSSSLNRSPTYSSFGHNNRSPFPRPSPKGIKALTGFPSGASSAKIRRQFLKKYKSPGKLTVAAVAAGKLTVAAVAAGKQTWGEFDSRSADEDWWKKFKQGLETLRGACAFCWVTTRSPAALDHDVETCSGRVELLPFTPYLPNFDECRSWRRKLKLDNYTCCFSCVLPQSVCSGGKTMECEFGRDFIAPAAFMVHFFEELREATQKLMNSEGPFNSESYREWCGRLVWYRGKKCNNLIKVYELVMSWLEED